MRASTLSVFEKMPGVYLVPGRESTYEVVVTDARAFCQCTAAKYDATCAHKIAALRHHERVSMAKFSPARNAGTDYKPQQLILLERGVYGAMFRGYSQPKDVPKYQSTETEKKMGFHWLVTHSSNQNPLPRFTAASTFVTLKWFYDPAARKQSKFFEIHAALLASKQTPEALYASSDDDLPDLDHLIGFPVQLMIEPSAKSNKNGVFHNNIASIMAASSGMRKVISPIYKSAEMTYDEKNGLRYLKSPKPEYEEELFGSSGPTNGASPASSTNDVIDGFAADDIPF